MDAEALLTVADLGALLGLAPETVRWYSTQSPDRLPPRVTWSKRPLWMRVVVNAWIEEHSGMKQRLEVEKARPELKRKGRPRRVVSLI
jgi:hypothetical protein